LPLIYADKRGIKIKPRRAIVEELARTRVKESILGRKRNQISVYLR
jgi:hypothetical protein